MIEAFRQRPLWMTWLLYFLEFAGVGVYFTFLNVYFHQVGLNGTQIGVLNMVSAIAGMAGAVPWGLLGDRTGKVGWLLATGALGWGATLYLVGQAHSFAAYLGLGCLGGLASAAVVTLLDSTTLALLGERRADYGRYRLGGTFGFICASAFAGFLFDWGGLQMMFPMFFLIMVAFAGAALLLPALPLHHEAHAGRAVSQMIRRPAWIVLMVCAFLCWIAVNGANQFLGVAMSAMNSSKGLIGLTMMGAAVVEIPCMLQSGALLQRFGAARLLWFSMLLLILRFALFGWMPAPIWAIPINAINGPAFAFFWSSAVKYTNEMAPPALTATAQGLLNTTLGLAGVVGALLCGWLFDQFGSSGLFYLLAAGCLAAFVLFGAGLRLRQPAQEAAD